MEPDRSVASVTPVAVPSGKQRIIECIAANASALLASLRTYVWRMGLARGEDVAAVADEVLQEVVIEALDHADRFQLMYQPMPWLLGIGANIIKRKKVEFAKHSRREVLIGEFARAEVEPLHDDELFDQLLQGGCAGPEQEVVANEQAVWLLSLVEAEDRELLQLAFLYGFEREALAQRLGVTPGAARVRLHRTLQRLRLAWREHDGNLRKGADE